MNLNPVEIRCQNCFSKNTIEISEIREGRRYTCRVCEERVASDPAIFRKAIQAIRNENERIRSSYLSSNSAQRWRVPSRIDRGLER
jgi:protein-arginine kinase activator protein McsA